MHCVDVDTYGANETFGVGCNRKGQKLPLVPTRPVGRNPSLSHPVFVRVRNVLRRESDLGDTREGLDDRGVSDLEGTEDQPLGPKRWDRHRLAVVWLVSLPRALFLERAIRVRGSQLRRRFRPMEVTEERQLFLSPFKLGFKFVCILGQGVEVYLVRLRQGSSLHRA